ncbi:hypothetical protein [Bifidobacterium thermophilum]|uniref:hypothetical protein n=1 Tax=Bifidobacterium thermophilum TaxID=33905 RepID=UPI003BB7C412
MADDTRKPGDPGDPDGTPPSDDGEPSGDGLHFNDAELEAAMADFEREFEQDTAGDQAGRDHPADLSDTQATGQQTASNAAGGPDMPDDPDMPDNPAGSAVFDISDIEDPDAAAPGDSPSAIETSFDDELQGLLGNKAKVAAIITRLTSAELLAAFCQLSDISAICLDDPQGAVAVLRNLDGDGPEAAAKDLTTVVSGMPAVLVVNRADKLEATMYLQGETRDSFAPPILFSAAAPFVEDLMLGIAPLSAILEDTKSFDSDNLDRDQALAILARHTRFGRGNSSIA